MKQGRLMLCTVLFAIHLLSLSASAQSLRQEAQDAAGASVLTEEVVKSREDQLEDIVPGYETSNPQTLTRHYEEEGGALEDATLDRLARPNDGQGGEAGNLILESYTDRPDVSVTREESWLSQSRGTLANPDLLAGDLFTTTQNPACEPEQINSTPFEIRSCDTFGAPEDHTCGLGTEVDVLAEKTYACFRETETYLKRCEETLEVSCRQVVSNCRIGDGLITTPDSDLQISYTNGRHRAHLPTKSIGDRCQTFTRRMIVNISDITKLVTARLSRVEYHDALTIYVNGTPVFGGPYGDGNDQNLLGTWVQDIGHDDQLITGYGLGNPESRININATGTFRTFLGSCFQERVRTATPGISIKPLLNEGPNTIQFRNVIGSNGGFTADFQIHVQCCAAWDEEWVQTCPY